MQDARFYSTSHTIGRGFFLTTRGPRFDLYIDSPATVEQIDTADLARALREAGITCVDRALDAVSQAIADEEIRDRPVMYVLSVAGEVVDSWTTARAGARMMQREIQRLIQSAAPTPE